VVPAAPAMAPLMSPLIMSVGMPVTEGGKHPHEFGQGAPG
jgi:hypothetical protein